MRQLSLLLLFSLTFHVGYGQLEARVETTNPSLEINDGIARVIVESGTPPFTYKWSDEGTALDSDVCKELTENRTFHVTVTDATGAEVRIESVVPAESFEERMNASFIPIVNGIASVLFWDPFAAIGIYDPVVYDQAGNPVLHPNGDPKEQGIPFIVVWLVFGAIFFTIKMRFINFRGVGHAFELLRGKYDDPKNKGEVSHFQALTTALSATVGLGNIAGVAIAISLGGPGATFWMICAGLLGMASKFTECTLGVKYRFINEKGEVSGGPMYYLSRALTLRGLGGLGKVLAAVFAVLCIGGSFGGGNMFQANQAWAQMAGKVPFFLENRALFGLILAILVGLVIIGGIKSIAKVTDKIVPFMVGVYVLFALIIIGANISQIGEAFGFIFTGAFSPEAMKGGFIGVLIVGFQRAAFSNEAGVGSAAIAHSASKTDEPISEGIVALLEPFIDTVVVCTMTALVLIFTGFAFDTTGLEGSQLTSAAFSSVFSWFDWVLLIAIMLFAFSTMISWSYYGLKAWTYLFGDSRFKANLYKFIFLLFIVIGASTSLGAVLDFSDLMILGMAFPNILGLLILVGEVRNDLKDYLYRIKSGEIRRFE
jgi:AGCS family alanine or glycine:cation symporter